ncbi:hypothetical protein LOY89_002740 [Ophidiomyces ophidiicola]|uniref:Uncharacterized protein n=1 Tax=Ophidiomyces ophidiicola TaxID=1387563 RepID=A0ACB8UNQ3_9EURO|nr:hypothetical protein LOZ64_003386 [Ophidiomyces ophidiicola]KAI1969631.1 hypothetical protein LOZ56_004265 [Ophidiomyces ophidiicola]KAI2008479.1 hypothetical protein LOZ49_004249 [Ophidiomyces ophidiicola]KAI2038084.1 hypothetical protein LOZ47_003424 [Ophidiomyces ophidiicola]KAI2055599.1 hypothetical protein LOZ44_002137 [Ophidiomyces ophidiicola]
MNSTMCPPPFLNESQFPKNGGFLAGRTCDAVTMPSGVKVRCCLPCPQAEWRYTDDFLRRTKIASWLALAVFILNTLMLLTYAVLPAKATRRHYLSICLISALMMMELSFIIPLAAQPAQCYDAITPHDMRSDLTCAFTSALILGGGWAAVLWSFCRTLSLHVQICWDVVPGRKFFISTMCFGWGIPIIGLATAMAVTGTSYRFGSICHINHEKGLFIFWGPLMTFAGATMLIHLTTLGYCIHVYVKSILDTKPTTENSGPLPSYTGSERTMSARQTYRRVKRILLLQWRGFAVVFTILANVVFFTVVFLGLDNAARRSPENVAKSQPWIACLVLSSGNADECARLAASLGPSESSVLAVLILLGMSGFWPVIFLGHSTMITGWRDWIKQKIHPNREFVSMDARKKGSPTRAYEMLAAGRQPSSIKSPEPLLSPVRNSDHSIATMNYSAYASAAPPTSPDPAIITPEARYHSPPLSFSTPRPPSQRGLSSPSSPSAIAAAKDWDPQATFAPSRAGGKQWHDRPGPS